MKTEIENLRELDAWIAEHVMGVDRNEIQAHWFCSHCAEPRLPQQVTYSECCEVCGHAVDWNACNPYTTDPAAAMQVLEKCCKVLSPDGGGNSVAVEWNGDVEESWRVVETDCADCVEAEAPTLPLTICKFAKALYSK